MSEPIPPRAPVALAERRSVSWTVYALIVALLAVFAIAIWQLGKLDPAQWCDVAIGASDKAGRPLAAIQSCFSLLSDMLGIYKQNTLALIALVAVLVITLAVTTLRARVSLDAFGAHANIGGDPPVDVIVRNDKDQAVPVDQSGANQ